MSRKDTKLPTTEPTPDIAEAKPAEPTPQAEVKPKENVKTIETKPEANPVQPANIEGRKTVVNKTLSIKNRKITLKVWDSSIEDGDIISIYVNGVKRFADILLTTKPKEFTFDLETGENFITAHVESFGKREPNSAAISVNDGKKEQRIILNATRNQEETMKVIVE
jgi:hypothetical protein